MNPEGEAKVQVNSNPGGIGSLLVQKTVCNLDYRVV